MQKLKESSTGFLYMVHSSLVKLATSNDIIRAVIFKNFVKKQPFEKVQKKKKTAEIRRMKTKNPRIKGELLN